MFGKKTGRGQEATEQADARLLEDRVYALERDMKSIRVEWETMYDQFRRLLAKLSKREQRAAQDAPGATNGDSAGSLPQTMNPLARRLLDAPDVRPRS